MVPVQRIDQTALEQQLKDTIQSLHNIMVQVSAYDSSSTPLGTPNSISSPAGGGGSSRSTSKDVVATELGHLDNYLQRVHKTATTPSPEQSLPHIPPELIQYVDNGRNPDIYTREFVELVRRGNQLMRGKQNAFASFRDVLAGEMEKAMPELRDDIARTVRATGGAPRQ
ncbi:mediator complex, subunit Med10 [Biscogniauxia mediterranea]|nr:mediator complex, subunit Med10 [Biscogniauxia mediterranea]